MSFTEFVNNNQELTKKVIENSLKVATSDIWVHRMGSPEFKINIKAFENGLPLLLTEDEFQKLEIPNKNSVYENLQLLFFLEKEEIVDLLNQNGIAYEYLLMIIREKLLDLYGHFFDEGLYTAYSNLDRTAVQCSEESLKQLLKSKGLGWGNRPATTAIILRIPVECFSPENPRQLYEIGEPIEVYTEYFGMQTLTKKVPKEYIERIALQLGQEVVYINNPNFDKEYVPKANYTVELRDIRKR